VTVFFHCEGFTDNAVIQALVKKISKLLDTDIQLNWIQKDKLNKFKTHRKKYDELSSHYKLIWALADFSDENGSRYIAYHRDADRKYDNVYTSIISVFQILPTRGYHCLAIVPKEMIESWLLADENAYPSIPDNPKLPSKPEEIWGLKTDPASNHPYNYFVRVLDQYNLPDNRDTYKQIAENTDIEILKRRCPKSLEQFFTDMQSFIIEEPAP
jgi:hypothetical protein